MLREPLQTRSLAPHPPLPPEIEGYLKKLKRKTSNLTGSWNKRWFFVDPKRLEFGYSNSKSPTAPRSSIYLNDITAVLQFDDTHFQVESRTRNFFLCGESKASTTCWVKSLEEYRKKQVEYEKALARLATSAPPLSTEESISSPPKTSDSLATNQLRHHKSTAGASRSSTSGKKARGRHADEPARDSQDSANLSAHASSSSNLAEEKPARFVSVIHDVDVMEESRLASPIEGPRRDHELRRESRAKAGDRRHETRDSSRSRDRDTERERERDRDDRRERGRDRERESRHRERDRDADDERASVRDRSTSAQCRNRPDSGSSSRTNSGRTGSSTGYAGHPTHGFVMHAWMDEFD